MAERTMAERTMAGRIRVSGFRRPRMIWPPRRRSRWVAPVRLFNLLWLVPLLAAPALPNLLPDLSGTPHLLLFSTSTGEGIFKYYTDCAYIGLDGSMTHTGGSSCPLIRLLKSNPKAWF